MERCDVAILGAGPYGLAAAAHLRRIRGLDVALFGEPMSFWERHMPAGMCMRSPWDASHISDPENRFTLDAYRHVDGPESVGVPIGVQDFIKYGRWFLGQIGLTARTTKILRIEKAGDDFRVALENGTDLHAGRVVIAAGVQPFAHRPDLFARLPPELVTHTSEHRDFGRFRGKDVFVIGAGTSAIEAAMFLREADANVEVLIRDSLLRWPRQWMHAKPLAWMFYGRGDVGPAIVSLIVQRPQLFRRLPRWVQTWWGRRAIRPSVLPRLKPGVASIPIHTSRSVMRLGERNGRLHVQLNDGTTRVIDHIVLGTGYRVDVARYPFLPSALLDRVARSGGLPILDGGFETSLSGVHFVGAPASWSFGPLMRFVAGTEFAARTLARRVAAAGARDVAFDTLPARALQNP